MTIRSVLRAGIITSMLALAGIGSASAANIDLGFALDESGSISGTNFSLARTGLSNALGNIPVGGANTYRVSVVAFSGSARTVITQTINTAADRALVQAAVAGVVQQGGGTCISCATSQLVTNFSAGPGLGASTLFNITTDGETTSGVLSGTTLRSNLLAAGVDTISAEAVGTFDTAFLLALTGASSVITDPANLPNAYTSGFVLRVDNFADYQGAINAKIQNIVAPPTAVPGPIAGVGLLPLLGFAFAWRARRRKHLFGLTEVSRR